MVMETVQINNGQNADIIVSGAANIIFYGSALREGDLECALAWENYLQGIKPAQLLEIAHRIRQKTEFIKGLLNNKTPIYLKLVAKRWQISLSDFVQGAKIVASMLPGADEVSADCSERIFLLEDISNELTGLLQ